MSKKKRGRLVEVHRGEATANLVDSFLCPLPSVGSAPRLVTLAVLLRNREGRYLVRVGAVPGDAIFDGTLMREYVLRMGKEGMPMLPTMSRLMFPYVEWNDFAFAPVDLHASVQVDLSVA